MLYDAWYFAYHDSGENAEHVLCLDEQWPKLLVVRLAANRYYVCLGAHVSEWLDSYIKWCDIRFLSLPS